MQIYHQKPIVFFANMPQYVKEPAKVSENKIAIIGTFQEYQSIFILEKNSRQKTNI
jgi:hypothetical protein